jgi:hypothetical protein
VHDVLAELEGYRNELANALRRGNETKAAAVREQVDRVKADVEARAVAAEQRAESYKDDGQDVLAAQHEVEARIYRTALDEPAALETAVESAPRERAVPRKAGR